MTVAIDSARSWRDPWIAAGVALAARLLVVAWAAHRFPPAGDGYYYDALARRIAHGDGYTWLWPDGAVTYAAHYPVGYPALVGAFYAVFGTLPVVAMIVNAVLGAIAAFASHRLLAPATTPILALAGALSVALHPALVPYTAAIMTEGVTAALLCVAAALAQTARDRARRTPWFAPRPDFAPAPKARICGRSASVQRWKWQMAAAATMGVATLVRPQCLILAPILGALMVPADARLRARIASATVVTVLAISCCLPWTLRNCSRMGRCALVSVNGGWNLLIGTQTPNGAWAPVDVPPACREVWDEAAKDACFEREARASVGARPRAWLARAPAKLAATFDYFGAAPWYLNLSNGGEFSLEKKNALATIEAASSRIFLLGALLSSARRDGPRRRARLVLAGVAALFAVMLHAWPAYLALVLLLVLPGMRAIASMPLLAPWAAAVLASTAVTHAAFFGAGRYGLVVVPLVTLLAFVGRGSPRPPLDSASVTSSASQGSLSRPAAARS